MTPKFSVGDRVAINASSSYLRTYPNLIGAAGTIVLVFDDAVAQEYRYGFPNSSEGYLYGIEFDEPLDKLADPGFGHSCHGFAKFGYGRNIRERHIDLISNSFTDVSGSSLL